MKQLTQFCSSVAVLAVAWSFLGADSPPPAQTPDPKAEHPLVYESIPSKGVSDPYVRVEIERDPAGKIKYVNIQNTTTATAIDIDSTNVSQNGDLCYFAFVDSFDVPGFAIIKMSDADGWVDMLASVNAKGKSLSQYGRFPLKRSVDPFVIKPASPVIQR